MALEKKMKHETKTYRRNLVRVLDMDDVDNNDEAELSGSRMEDIDSDFYDINLDDGLTVGGSSVTENENEVNRDEETVRADGEDSELEPAPLDREPVKEDLDVRGLSIVPGFFDDDVEIDPNHIDGFDEDHLIRDNGL